MVTTTLPGVLLTGIHSARPAANAVGTGTLYSCTTHSLVYQSDGSTWSTWASLAGTGMTNPMTTRGDVIIENSSPAPARLAIGSAGKFLRSDGTDPSWQAPTDADLSTSDITTNNVSITKHGFAPKAPNVATQYLDGTGAYSTPAGLTNPITYIDGTVAAAPSTPSAGALRIYAKTGKVLAVKDDAGLETVLGQGIADQGTFTFLDATGASAPATPASGKARIYAKTDGRIYSKDDAGVEYGPFDASGGGGGPLLYADATALSGSGDDFASTSLPLWTLAGGLTTGAVTAITTEPYDATCLDINFAAQGYRMYQAVVAGAFTMELSFHGMIGAGQMMGLYLSDNSGNGTLVTPYSDNNVYLMVLTANAYSGTGPVLPGTGWPPVVQRAAGAYSASHMPLVITLARSGTTLTGGFSDNGGVSFVTNTRTDTTTFTRMGIIAGFTSGGGTSTLRVGRFNTY